MLITGGSRVNSEKKMMQVEGFPIGQEGELTISAVKLPELDKCALLTIDGQIYSNKARILTEAGMKIIDAGFINLIFVLKAGRLGHSLGSFCSMLRSIGPTGGKIALVSIIKEELEAFRYSGWDSFFVISDSVPEAVSKLPRFVLPDKIRQENEIH
jgi:hypothetical protein